MKNDLNDLKQLVFELVQSNNLKMPALPSRVTSRSRFPEELNPILHDSQNFDIQKEMDNVYNEYGNSPVILEKDSDTFSQAEEVEENLSLDEKTKELITKALKKHRGRRKDAAVELGISERTLYRKIKEYEIAT